jgi:hypothetical protein
MGSSDDLFGNDAENDAGMDEFERHGRTIHELVSDYLEEHEIPDSAGCLLLLNASISMRMIAYAIEVEKPSGGGLKLDLDRFRREMDEAVRAAKKGAEEFIEGIKPVLAAERSGDNEEDEDEGAKQ